MILDIRDAEAPNHQPVSGHDVSLHSGTQLNGTNFLGVLVQISSMQFVNREPMDHNLLLDRRQCRRNETRFRQPSSRQIVQPTHCLRRLLDLSTAVVRPLPTWDFAISRLYDHGKIYYYRPLLPMRRSFTTHSNK
jgi:hypothetical protein